MKLFCTQRSPYARKVRIVALEKQVPLDLVEEDLMNKSSALLAANPVGKIPVLQLDNGRTLADSPLICEYLDGLNDSPVLIPRDKDQRLAVLQDAGIADGLMDVTVSAYMEKFIHGDSFQPKFVFRQEQTIQRCLAYFERHIDRLEALTLGPIAVASAIGYLAFRHPHLWPQADCPQLYEWFEAFSKRQSMLKTLPRA